MSSADNFLMRFSIVFGTLRFPVRKFSNCRRRYGVHCPARMAASSSGYAPYLEYGTYKMAARPHIIPGVESVVPAWVAAIEAIGGDI